MKSKNETCKGCISEFEEESPDCIYCARRCDDNYRNKKEEDISDANKDYKRFFEATKLIIKKQLEKRSIKEVETLVASCLLNENIQIAMLKNDKIFQEFLKENGLFLEEDK